MPPAVVLFVVTVIWGSSFVVSKHVVRELPPVPYLALRYVLASVVMLLVVLRRPESRGDRRLTRDGIAIGVMNAVALSFQLVGQLWTTAAKSAFITSLYMPLVPIIGRLFYETRPTRAQVVAIALGTFGVGLLTYPSSAVAWNPGDLLTMVSALLYSFTIIETSRRSQRHDAVRLSMLQIVTTAGCFVLFLGVVVAVPATARPSWAAALPERALAPSAWAGLAYMVLVCTVGTFLLQNWALGRLPVTHATLIFSLEAPVATLIGLIADGREEWPGARGALGALAMLTAVGLSQRNQNQVQANPS